MTTQNVNALSPVGYLNTVTGHLWSLTEQPEAIMRSGLYEPLVLAREALAVVQQKEAAEALNKHLDLAVRKAEGVANSLRERAERQYNDSRLLEERTEKAGAELAALRGEQEPACECSSFSYCESCLKGMCSKPHQQAIDHAATALQSAADSKALQISDVVMDVIFGVSIGGDTQMHAKIHCAVSEALKPLMAQAAGLPPVGEIVAWAGTDKSKGVMREVDFRFLRFDVEPGSKLYEHPATEALSANDYEEVLASNRALVRELDVLLNGDNAAKQASLCDIVGQVRSEVIKAGLPAVSFYRDGIVDAANWVDQSREAFERENGRHDPDTGTFEFSNDAGREYSAVLLDVAEGIRLLHPNAAARAGKPFKDVAPNDVVPVGNNWFRVRYITRHGNSTSLHLQREAEQLSPLSQNDVIHLSVDNSIPMVIAVKGGE